MHLTCTPLYKRPNIILFFGETHLVGYLELVDEIKLQEHSQRHFAGVVVRHSRVIELVAEKRCFILITYKLILKTSRKDRQTEQGEKALQQPYFSPYFIQAINTTKCLENSR